MYKVLLGGTGIRTEYCRPEPDRISSILLQSRPDPKKIQPNTALIGVEWGGVEWGGAGRVRRGQIELPSLNRGLLLFGRWVLLTRATRPFPCSAPQRQQIEITEKEERFSI